MLKVLYLIFNEGYTGEVDLAAEAIRLTRQLASSGEDPEVAGLLALMLLHHARRAARFTADGSLVPLAEQDRSRWDRDAIAEGVVVIQAALARDRLGEYQAQAAIAALHADAPSAQETDWPQVLEWYDELARLTDSPVVALNRAVAVGEVDGPLAGLRPWRRCRPTYPGTPPSGPICTSGPATARSPTTSTSSRRAGRPRPPSATTSRDRPPGCVVDLSSSGHRVRGGHMRGRRGRLTATIVATAALAACVSTGPGEVAQAQAPQPPETAARPNVVMITLDDLAEGDLSVMPRTRRLLADQGTTMTQGLAPTPICAPARASLLTGQYAHNHGVLTVEGQAGGAAAFDDRRTLPTWLRTAGYDTMFAGKYLNGYGTKNPRYVPKGWNEWRGSVDFSTYSFFRTRFNVNGTVVQPPGYSTDILARYTEEMLAKHRRGRLSSHPFFLWVNYVAPHHGGPDESDDPKRVWPRGRTLATTAPAPRDRNAFSDVALPKGPAMWERDLRGNHHAEKKPPRGYRAAVREAHQQRLESLLAVDRGGRTDRGRTASLRRARPDRDRTDLGQRLHGRPAQPGRQAVVLRRVGADPDHPARPWDPPRASGSRPRSPTPTWRSPSPASPGPSRPAASTGWT